MFMDKENDLSGKIGDCCSGSRSSWERHFGCISLRGFMLLGIRILWCMGLFLGTWKCVSLYWGWLVPAECCPVQRPM